MQIGEQQLPFGKLRPFGWLGFFHLHDHVRTGEHFLRCINDFSARCDIDIIGLGNADPCPAFHDDIVTVLHIFAHGLGR